MGPFRTASPKKIIHQRPVPSLLSVQNITNHSAPISCSTPGVIDRLLNHRLLLESQPTHPMANSPTSAKPNPPFAFSCALDSELVIEGRGTLAFQFRTRPHLEVERFQIVRSNLITKKKFSRTSGPSAVGLRNRFWYLIDSFRRTGKFLSAAPTTEVDQKKFSKAIHYAEMVLRILSQMASQTDMPEDPKSGEEQPKNLPTQHQSPPTTTTRSYRGKARKAATRGHPYSARASAPSSFGRKPPQAFQATRRTFYRKQAANRSANRASEPSSPEVIHVPDDSPAKTNRQYKSPARTRSSGPASPNTGTVTKVFPAVADVMGVVNEARISSPIQRTVDKRPSESNAVHADPYARENASPENEQFRISAGNEHRNSGSDDRMGDSYGGMEEEILDEGREDDPRASGEEQDAMHVDTPLQTPQSPFTPSGASPGPVESPEQAHSHAQAPSPPARSETHEPSHIHSPMQEPVSNATVLQSKPAVQWVSTPPPSLGKQSHPVATKLSKSNMQQLPKGQAQGNKPVEMMYSVRSMPAAKSTNPSALQEAMRMAHVKLFEEKQNMEVQRKRIELEARRLHFEEDKRKDKDAQVLRDLVRRRVVDKQRATVEKRRLEIDEDRLKLDTERLEKEVPWRERSYEQNLQQSAKRIKLDMKRYELEEKNVKAQMESRKERLELQKQERKDRLAQANRSYELRVEELRLRTASEKEMIELENRKLLIEEQKLEMLGRLQTAVLGSMAAFGHVMSGTN